MIYYDKLQMIEKINQLIKAYDLLEQREFDILSARGWFGNEKKSFEEIGKLHNVSRERIRQIENAAIKHLKTFTKGNKLNKALFEMFEFISSNIKCEYITIDALMEYTTSYIDASKFAYLYYIKEIDIRYSEDYKIVYNSFNKNIEDIVDKIYCALKYSYTMEEYNDLPYTAQSIINKKFYKRNESFVKKNYLKSNDIANIISKQFPDGIKPGNDSHLKKLNECISYYMGGAIEPLTSRGLFALIERENFCQVARGTYIPRDKTIILPDRVINKLLKLINLHEPKIYYEELYEMDKNELSELGINNYYYLKGLLDEHLPAKYVHRRNYIITEDFLENMARSNMFNKCVENKKESIETTNERQSWKKYIIKLKSDIKEHRLEERTEIPKVEKNVIMDLDSVTVYALAKSIKSILNKHGNTLSKVLEVMRREYKALLVELPKLGSENDLKMLILRYLSLDYYIDNDLIKKIDYKK